MLANPLNAALNTWLHCPQQRSGLSEVYGSRSKQSYSSGGRLVVIGLGLYKHVVFDASHVINFNRPSSPLAVYFREEGLGTRLLYIPCSRYHSKFHHFKLTNTT